MSGRKLCPEVYPCSALFLDFIQVQCLLELLPAILWWVPDRIIMPIIANNHIYTSLQNLTGEVFEKPVSDLAVFNHWQLVSQEYLQILHCYWICLPGFFFFILSELRETVCSETVETILVSSYDSCFDASEISYYSGYPSLLISTM